MGSVPPLRRFNALEACLRCDLLRDPRVRQGPFRAFVPLQRRSPQPRPVPPVREPARRTEQPLLGFCCPTTQSESVGVADRGSTRDPMAACGVWLPPARPVPTSYRRAKRRSIHGLPPSGPSPRARCGSSRSRCPPGVTGRRAAPGGARGDAADFRALLSARVRSVTVPCGTAVDALLGFIPPEPSLPPSRPALWSRGLPSYPTHGLTSQPGGVPGSSEAGGSAWSVSGLPALMGFVTS